MNGHPLLFSPNPPNDEKFVRELFCMRKREIRQSLDCLHSSYDYGKICAIFGQTQVGKSHFAKYIISKIVSEAPEKYYSIEINANNERTCIGLLAGIYRGLARRFQQEVLACRESGDNSNEDLIELCGDKIENFAAWEKYGNLKFIEKELRTEDRSQINKIR